ncbi:MAG TPA: HAD family hydrolase [Thermomicrobiales bacterium]|nr:HAD family hydrolase [Thermomicrobiales bacterium]
MAIQGMIFDFDGTLGDTLQLCCAAFREVTQRRLGRDFSDAEIMALFGPSEDGIFQQLAGDGWQDCHADFLAIYERDHATSAELFPGIPEMLAVLRERDIPAAIVTGKSAESAAISLRQLELAAHFDIVEAGSPEGSVKPVAIRRILERWKIDPATVAYVGDAPNDVSEAHAAGVIPLAAAWAATVDRAALEARKPAATFASPADLTTWIRHNA